MQLVLLLKTPGCNLVGSLGGPSMTTFRQGCQAGRVSQTCGLLLPACDGCLDTDTADKDGSPYSRTPCMQHHHTLAIGLSIAKIASRYDLGSIKLCAAHNKGAELDHCPSWGCAQSVKVSNANTRS